MWRKANPIAVGVIDAQVARVGTSRRSRRPKNFVKITNSDILDAKLFKFKTYDRPQITTPLGGPLKN